MSGSIALEVDDFSQPMPYCRKRFLFHMPFDDESIQSSSGEEITDVGVSVVALARQDFAAGAEQRANPRRSCSSPFTARPLVDVFPFGRIDFTPPLPFTMTAMDEHSDDMLEGLEERLQSHNKAFESLLALTPAREYFGSQIVDGLDPSEQWTRKKQSKEQKKAAKKAKLDPANQMSALDVMKERERKRKRELGIDEEAEDEGVEGPAKQQVSKPPPTNKRQKVEISEEAQEAKRKAKADKRKEKREAKKEKMDKKKAKVDAKKAAKQGHAVADGSKSGKQDTEVDEENMMDSDTLDPTVQAGELDGFDASGLAISDQDDDDDDEDGQEEASSAPSSPVDSPAFDISANHSTTSSSSSIIPPSEPAKAKQSAHNSSNSDIDGVTTVAEKAEKKSRDPPSGTSSPKVQIPKIDQAELQERLRQRIEELRAKRKADGPDGKPVKSRQDLLEQRRKKDEQRKAAKKDQRRKAKEEEARKQEAQLRGSGSPLSREMFGTQSPQPENHFSFSRLAFQDGSAADAELTTLSDPKQRKGRSDPKTALEAAQNKQKRLAGYDAAKQAEIAEKDVWLNAKKRAHGEKIRDDTSLLKKALKRKEKEKSKSETAWKERVDAVVHGKEMKQKKRERNLAKRRDEKKGGGKSGKGSKGGSSSAAKKGGKKSGRPGFEGRFKA
nr:ribosomal rna-processing protein 14 [Quercus suber]